MDPLSQQSVCEETKLKERCLRDTFTLISVISGLIIAVSQTVLFSPIKRATSLVYTLRCNKNCMENFAVEHPLVEIYINSGLAIAFQHHTFLHAFVSLYFIRFAPVFWSHVAVWVN